MDRKSEIVKIDGSSLKDRIALKKRRYLNYPFIQLMTVGVLKNLICRFAGIWSRYPVRYLMMETLTKDDKYTLDIFLGRISDSWESVGEMSPIETISLYRWYEWVLGFCTKGSISYTITRRSVSPYDSRNTLEDIQWYFSGEYGFSPPYGKPRKWSKDYEWNSYTDMIVLKEHLGEIKISDVEMNKLNTLRPIIGGRWDIADKYIKRGDVENPDDFYHGLKGRLLGELLRRYDMYETFTKRRIRSCITFGRVLMEGGILHKKMVALTVTSDVADELKIPLSSLPMNVIEDLFAVAVIRCRLEIENGTTKAQNESNKDMWERFFHQLCMSGKSTPPSSIHRAYDNKYINGIISKVRGGDKDSALSLIHDIRLDFHVPELSSGSEMYNRG